MASLASINVKFTTDLNQFRTGMQKAEKSIAKMSKSMQKYGAVMSATVTAPLTAVGIAAFKMAADLEDAIGATDQIFKGASESVKNWANSLPSYYGIAKNEAHEYANMMGSMLKNIGGLTEEEASAQSAKLIELAGDLTAMYGGTTADAVRALTGALKGNNTMLDNYGMAANNAIVKAKALEMGLISQGQEMSLAAKQAATLAVIYEQVGDAQGQAERESLGASGAMRALKTSISNLTTEFGEHLLPIFTPLINKINSFVEYFRELSPVTKRWIVILGGIAAAIGPLLALAGTILPAIIAGFGLLSAKVLLVVGAIAAVGYVVYQNWGSISRYMKKLTNDVIDLYNEFDAIRWVIHGTIGFFKSLFEVGVLIFKGLGRVVKTFVDGVINNFKGIGRAWDAIKSGNFDQLGKVISESTGDQMANLSGLVNGVLKDANTAAKKIDGHISEVKKKAQIKIDKDSFNASVAETLDGAKGVFNQFGQDAGEEVAAGVAKGLGDGLKNALDDDLGGQANEAVKTMSKEMAWRIENWRYIQSMVVEVPKKFVEAQPLLQKSLSDWEATMIDFSQRFGDLVAGLKENMAVGIGEALGGILSGNANFGSALEGILQIFGDFLKQFGKMAIGLGIAAMEIGKNLFSNPFGAIAAGIALVALGTAIRSLKIPKMASGGVVSGRTLVEVGEYANASVNPEVIAPLDKLEGMIQGNGVNMPSVIRLTGKGDELQGVIDRTNYLNSRA